MFNKLSFLPAESHYPLCCLAIDDFDFNEQNPHLAQNDIVDARIDEEYSIRLKIQHLFDGKLSKTELEQLYGEMITADMKQLHLNIEGEGIDYESIFYVCSIIASGDANNLSNISQKDLKADWWKPNYRFWMQTLAWQIHIWLKSEDEMPKGLCGVEYYGCYFSGAKKYHYPYILLCPERIENELEVLRKRGVHLTSKDLYAIVIIHAFAHAIMDLTNELNKKGEFAKLRHDDKERYQQLESETDVLMEESLASMITLQYFEAARKRGYISSQANVREFIENLPIEQKFGLLQNDVLKPDWRAWREYKRKQKIYCEI